MIRMLLLIVFLTTALQLPNATAQKAETTLWKGTLDAGGMKLRLEIDVTKTGKKLTGNLTSLDQGNAKLKIANIKLDKAHFKFKIPALNAKFSGDVSSNGDEAQGIFQQGGARLPLTLKRGGAKAEAAKPAGKLKEAWIGKIDMGLMKPVMQFRLVEQDGVTNVLFDSVTEERTGFKGTWSIKGDELKFVIPKIKLKYTGKLNKTRDEAKGTWVQSSRSFPLTLKKSATAYSSENVWENRPQRPKGPFPYDAEKVTFENKVDKLKLAGTLTIPKKPGKHPVVVLISGSGPQDRDESLMQHKPFLVLADYLSRRGIAVLRYDDRGSFESTGDFDSATTEDFARDASAAVEFLKTHKRINPKQIGLAGHSEGGLIAPMVVGLRDDVAFVALLAATGVDGKTISISQNEAMMRAAGIDESEIKIAMAVSRGILNLAYDAQAGTDLTDSISEVIENVIATIPESDREESGKELRAGIPKIKKEFDRPWFRFFLTYDPRPALENIKCPVLAIIGTKDTQVLPNLNAPEIRKALTKGGNQDFEMVRIEGLNHLFQKCDTGAIGEYIDIKETFNPKALKKIGDWIINHTTPIK